ncbi:MAG: hypothetical protein ABIP55_04645 [Tepidisphaeraceae bacterium]
MTTSRLFDLQPLESRRFLSVTPAHVGDRIDPFVDCPEVIEAREGLQDAAQQVRKDKREGLTAIRADQLAIREEYQQLIDEEGAEAVQDALAPLREKLREDTRLKNKELRAAAEELRIAKRAGRQLLAADLLALREANESGDQAAIDAAKAKLDADRAKLQEDLKPIRDEILAIKQEKRELLAADHAAIESKLKELNPDLIPLFDDLHEDAAALEAKLQISVAAVTDATEALKQAIADCREEHAGEHTA